MKAIKISFPLIILIHVLLFMNLNVSAQKSHSHQGGIEFIENKNQWDQKVLYRADIGGGAIFLEKSCFTFVFKDSKAINKILQFKTTPREKRENLRPEDFNIKCHAYKLNFLNSSSSAVVSGSEQREGYFNYYIGNDKSKWASRVKSYGEVSYKELYDKIDLSIYESQSNLKYDIILHPGADASKIQFQYEGADKVMLRNGNLIVATSVNEVTELSPVAYQMHGSIKKEVSCKFKLDKTVLTFVFPDGYDKTKELVIDPTLIFSTYSGSTADNWGFTATFDTQGQVYSGGIAFGTGYPVSVGAFQMNFGGGATGAYLTGCDVAIIKYNSIGTQRIWASYLGGSGNDLPHSMIVNNVDELCVFGTTGSSNFPVTSGSFDQTFNGGDSMDYDFNSLRFGKGIDIFVTKIKSDGSQLLASTYVGGTKNDGMNDPSILSKNYADGARGEIMTDKNNNVYVVSTTNSGNFPITAGAFQTSSGGGGQDGVVFKMDAGLSNMIWSSYLGGSGRDATYGIVLDNAANVFVTGGTSSTNFPVTPGTLHAAYMGGTTDGYITKISANGSTILKSTYYGSNAYDQSYLIETDKAGNIYVYGQTAATGNTFIFNAAWNMPNGGQFISKINPDLNVLEWSTAFGTGNGGPDISPTAFLVDLCNKIYLSGWGGPAINGFGGTNGLPITSNAFQSTSDNNDYYFLVIEDDASALVYATYFGSPHAQEHVDGGTSRFDRTGRIYQSVCAGCGGWDDFPTTPGAWSQTNNSSNCNNAVIKYDFSLPLVVADFIIPPVGCAPYNANFVNTSSYTGSSLINYYWTFGDGGISINENPVHNYVASGIYDVTLIVSDTGSCNLADTITKQVVVLNDSTSVLPTVNICKNDFTQIGLLPLPDTSLTYQWTPQNYLSDSNIPNPVANPPATTDYVLLISNGVCTDSIFQTVEVNTLTVDAGPDTTICSGSVLLNATAFGGATTFVWSSFSNFADTLNLSPDDNSVVVSPAATNLYYVQASNQFCTVLDSIKVNVSLIIIDASDNPVICSGDTTTISVQNLIPSNPLTYQWSPSGTVIGPADSSVAVVNPAATTIFFVTATDSTGCSVKDSVTVSVSAIQTTFTTDSVRCYNDTNGSATAFPVNGIPPYTFYWSNFDSTATISNVGAGNYTVTITDSTGCRSVLNVTVPAPPLLVAFISDSNMVECDSVNDGYATVSASGGTPSYHYLWGDGQTTPTADSLFAGTYLVTVSDHNGCSVSLQASIIDTSDFSASVNTVPPLCYGSCNALASALAAGGALPYTYNWDNSDNGPGADSLCAGVHSVMIHENNGCIRNIYFNLQQPSPVVVAPSVVVNPECNSYCNGAITIAASGGTPAYTYTWSNTQTSPAIVNLCAGIYYVTVYDSHNCPASDTITLTEPSPLLLNINTNPGHCADDCSGTAAAIVSGSVPPYTFSWSTGYTGNPAAGLCPGVYSVTITDSHSCKISDTATVHITPTFPVNINTYADDTTIYATQSTGIHTTVFGGYTYSWTPVAGLANPTVPNTVATPAATTTYYITIEDMYGCEYLDSVTIYVTDVLCDESQIFVPNAFTPNGDNKNDKVFVRSNVLKSIYFVLYDRWGEKVFETTDVSVGWDGTFKGKKCDPAVYDYYMKAACLDDKEFIKKGNITLIR